MQRYGTVRHAVEINVIVIAIITLMPKVSTGSNTKKDQTNKGSGITNIHQIKDALLIVDIMMITHLVMPSNLLVNQKLYIMQNL